MYWSDFCAGYGNVMETGISLSAKNFDLHLASKVSRERKRIREFSGKVSQSTLYLFLCTVILDVSFKKICKLTSKL
jgi:hypothetical protein